MWRDKFNKAQEAQKQEIEMRDIISNRLNGEIQDLKHELLIAKRILKDPQLSQLASRKFNETVNKDDDAKFLNQGAQLTALLDQEDE